MEDSVTHRLSKLYGLATAKRVGSVEGLRGFAMTLIFFGHFETLFRHYLPPGSVSVSLVDFVATIAHRGVSFFLIITGYFIYGKFLDRPEPYGPFVRRRLARVYPVFLSVLGIYLILSMLFPAESKIPHNAWNAALLIVENALLLGGMFTIPPIIVVSWTISYLVLFYLTVPSLVIRARMSSWTGWQRALFLVGLAVVWLKACAWIPGLSSRAVMFVPGMLIYEISRSPRFRARLSRWGEVRAVAILVLGFVLLNLMNKGLLWFLPGMALLRNYYWYAILAGGLFCFCLYCFAYDGFLKAGFSSTPLRCLGNMSYSYYLLHGLTLKGLALATVLLVPAGFSSSGFFWCALAAAYLATVVTATFWFRFVERYINSRVAPAARRMSRDVVNLPPNPRLALAVQNGRQEQD
jgi:exopolysaccharide production protein ExoZ